MPLSPRSDSMLPCDVDLVHTSDKFDLRINGVGIGNVVDYKIDGPVDGVTALELKLYPTSINDQRKILIDDPLKCGIPGCNMRILPDDKFCSLHERGRAVVLKPLSCWIVKKTVSTRFCDDAMYYVRQDRDLGNVWSDNPEDAERFHVYSIAQNVARDVHRAMLFSQRSHCTTTVQEYQPQTFQSAPLPLRHVTSSTRWRVRKYFDSLKAYRYYSENFGWVVETCDATEFQSQDVAMTVAQCYGAHITPFWPKPASPKVEIIRHESEPFTPGHSEVKVNGRTVFCSVRSDLAYDLFSALRKALEL